jgi:CDGSH-type Zn-finger protein
MGNRFRMMCCLLVGADLRGRKPGRGCEDAVMADDVVIKVRDDGPYKVTGPVTIIDPEGNEIAVPAGDAVILCRCGASRTKPFCDRAHKEIGFESRIRSGDGGTSSALPR